MNVVPGPIKQFISRDTPILLDRITVSVFTGTPFALLSQHKRLEIGTIVKRLSAESELLGWRTLGKDIRSEGTRGLWRREVTLSPSVTQVAQIWVKPQQGVFKYKKYVQKNGFSKFLRFAVSVLTLNISSVFFRYSSGGIVSHGRLSLQTKTMWILSRQTRVTVSEERCGKQLYAPWFIWRAVSSPLGGKTKFSLEDINRALISWENSSDAECCVPQLSAGVKITRLHMRN